MGIFDNKIYFNRESFEKLSFVEQRDVFLKIRAWVPDATKEVRYDKIKYQKSVLKKIEQVATYAVQGHIPAQDYMGYIYKRGFSNFFPVNYRRALEWNILAASNGSKFAPQKMKVFLNPAIDMILVTPQFPQIVEFNDLNKSNYFWFLSQYVCDILKVELKISEEEMMKKPLIEEDINQNQTIVFLDRFRDRSVRKAIENLEKAIPANFEVKSTTKVAEDLLKEVNENGDYDDIDIDMI